MPYSLSTLTKKEQIDTITALAGTHHISRTEKYLSNFLSLCIKAAFFGSYVLQTADDNPDGLGLIIIGCAISGCINAVLGGSVDTTIRRGIKGIKSTFACDTESLKETFFMTVLIIAAAYFGYAQSGPFAKGTQVALARLTRYGPDSILSKAVTRGTAAAEALFLTNNALRFFEKALGECCLKDKKKARIIEEANQPWECALQTTLTGEWTTFEKTLPASEQSKHIFKQIFTGIFIGFAYALTMASSTQAYVKNLALYRWLDALTLDGLPLGYAALNFTALFAYNGFVRGGMSILLDPFLRLKDLITGEGFFTRKDDHFLSDPEPKSVDGRLVLDYAVKAFFSWIGPALTYTSSIERAKAGYHAHHPVIDACNDYVLPVMAFLVNAFASFYLLKGLYRIFTCTTESEKAPLEGSDYRALRVTVKYLQKPENSRHPFWTAGQADLIKHGAQAYRDARIASAAAPADELKPLLE